MLNLSIDARDAMEMGGTLSGGTANVQLGPPVDPEEPPSGGSVAVEVTDAGDGMSKEVRFEPFFTTKEIGKGSGLGLIQVLGFAKQSGGGGRIRWDVGEGTTIAIFLPRADVRPVKTEVASARAPAQR